MDIAYIDVRDIGVELKVKKCQSLSIHNKHMGPEILTSSKEDMVEAIFEKTLLETKNTMLEDKTREVDRGLRSQKCWIKYETVK